MNPTTPPPTGQQPQQLSPQDYKRSFERPHQPGTHPMVVLQEGEVIVATIKRHPIGIVSLYAIALLGMAVTGVLAYFMTPDLLAQIDTTGNAGLIGMGVAVTIIVLLVLVLGVATSVYWQNEWVITTDSITQISQQSLFGRQVSQLSLDNLEDVTVDQQGIIPHIFNFGTLKAESAGERSKFVFLYCPNPNAYARKILELHEHFLEERRNIQRHRGFASITTQEAQPPQGI